MERGRFNAIVVVLEVVLVLVSYCSCCECSHGCCLATQPLASARRFEMREKDLLFAVLSVVVVVVVVNVLMAVAFQLSLWRLHTGQRWRKTVV